MEADPSAYDSSYYRDSMPLINLNSAISTGKVGALLAKISHVDSFASRSRVWQMLSVLSAQPGTAQYQVGHRFVVTDILRQFDADIRVPRPGTGEFAGDVLGDMSAGGKEIGHRYDLGRTQFDATLHTLLDTGLREFEEGSDHRAIVIATECRYLLRKPAYFFVGSLFTTAVGNQ